LLIDNLHSLHFPVFHSPLASFFSMQNTRNAKLKGQRIRAGLSPIVSNHCIVESWRSGYWFGHLFQFNFPSYDEMGQQA
jgi:hypothetical protein